MPGPATAFQRSHARTRSSTARDARDRSGSKGQGGRPCRSLVAVFRRSRRQTPGMPRDWRLHAAGTPLCTMRLRRVECSAPGIRRARRCRGFSSLDEDGTTIEDPEARERICELAIPPAWTDVWICPDPRGHIQATGYDDAGRKQYLYHEAWREHRDRQKFEQMEAFGAALPALRQRVERELSRRGLVPERVLGCAVRLLELGVLRIGSE